MAAEHVHSDEPRITMPVLTPDALGQAVADVAPSRLPEFFQDIHDAFSQAGDQDGVYPIRHFYQRWGATVAIERRPSVAARLHAAEQTLANPDAEARDRAIREAAEIAQAAYLEAAGGRVGSGNAFMTTCSSLNLPVLPSTARPARRRAGWASTVTTARTSRSVSQRPCEGHVNRATRDPRRYDLKPGRLLELP